MTLDELDTRLDLWHSTKYPNVWWPRTFLKLGEEYGEFSEALRKENIQEASLEAADIIFILFNLIRHLGGDLPKALVQKLVIIEARLTDPNAGRSK